jgi:hypothetical protein
MSKLRLFWLFGIPFCLTACEPSEFELRPVAVPLGSGNSSGSSVPKSVQTPLAPPKMHSESENVNIPGQQEVHAAATESDCYEMAKRFRKEGRKLVLKKVESSSGTDLPYLCIFEGEDAQEGYFDDRRYEKP